MPKQYRYEVYSVTPFSGRGVAQIVRHGKSVDRLADARALMGEHLVSEPAGTLCVVYRWGGLWSAGPGVPVLVQAGNRVMRL